MTKIHNARETRHGYGQWLETYDWSFFCTFTTGYVMTLKTARRLMRAYFSNISKGGPCNMFWAAEPFETKEGFHTHALLTPPQSLHFVHLTQIWQKVSRHPEGRYNRVQLLKYDPKRGASAYLSKYITKELADFDYYQQGRREAIASLLDV